jgi:hypothetical protein
MAGEDASFAEIRGRDQSRVLREAGPDALGWALGPRRAPRFSVPQNLGADNQEPAARPPIVARQGTPYVSRQRLSPQDVVGRHRPTRHREDTMNVKFLLDHEEPVPGQQLAVRRLFRIEGEAPPDDHTRPPLNVALVLDRSGSMAGEKLRFAREAASLLVRRLRPEDRVSAVCYDHQVVTMESEGRQVHEAAGPRLPAGAVSQEGAVPQGFVRSEQAVSARESSVWGRPGGAAVESAAVYRGRPLGLQGPAGRARSRWPPVGGTSSF